MHFLTRRVPPADTEICFRDIFLASATLSRTSSPTPPGGLPAGRQNRFTIKDLLARHELDELIRAHLDVARYAGHDEVRQVDLVMYRVAHASRLEDVIAAIQRVAATDDVLPFADLVSQLVTSDLKYPSSDVNRAQRRRLRRARAVIDGPALGPLSVELHDALFRSTGPSRAEYLTAQAHHASYALTPRQCEMAETLITEWVGTLEELLTTARGLCPADAA